jgi:hypothetical protein
LILKTFTTRSQEKEGSLTTSVTAIAVTASEGLETGSVFNLVFEENPGTEANQNHVRKHCSFPHDRRAAARQPKLFST